MLAPTCSHYCPQNRPSLGGTGHTLRRRELVYRQEDDQQEDQCHQGGRHRNTTTQNEHRRAELVQGENQNT